MSLVSILAGCSSTGGGIGGQQQAAVAPAPAVVEGTCPRVGLREGTANYRTYEQGGEDNADRVMHQAALTETTRSCTTNGSQITVNVTAAGRVVAGPKGGAGNVSMPIRVAVLRGDEVLYSELTQYQTVMANGAQTTQFVFSDPNVTIPADAAGDARIFVGFDEGPYDTP